MVVKPMGKTADGKAVTYEILYWSTSAGALLRWIKRNQDVTNLRTESDRPLTDDLRVSFEYRGHKFILETPFSDYWIQCKSEGCPENVIQDIVEYLRKKKVNKIREFFVRREYKRREKRKET